MAETKVNSFLEKERLGKLMWKYSIPCVISMLVAALYNIVDQIFIANADYLGSYGNAANTIVFPMTVVAIAIAVMIGDGCCTFVSISLGAREREKACRGIGSPRFAMLTLLIGAILNIILDPICIYILHWGMAGAAIATIIGQIVSAIMAAVYLLHMKAVTLRKDCFIFRPELMRKILMLGSASFLSQISIVLSMAATLNAAVWFGALDEVFGQPEYAQIPTAIVGIVMKFFQIVISISAGLAAGCIPIAGYNIGAKRNDRVLGLMKRLMTVEALVGVVASLIFLTFPNSLIRLFGSENESVYYTQFAVWFIRGQLCLLPLACMRFRSLCRWRTF